MYMSKQMRASRYLTDHQNKLARTLYLQALREAVSISRVQQPPPSPLVVVKKQKVAPNGGMLFRGENAMPGADNSTATPQADHGLDPVGDELQRWGP